MKHSWLHLGKWLQVGSFGSFLSPGMTSKTFFDKFCIARQSLAQLWHSKTLHFCLNRVYTIGGFETRRNHMPLVIILLMMNPGFQVLPALGLREYRHSYGTDRFQGKKPYMPKYKSDWRNVKAHFWQQIWCENDARHSIGLFNFPHVVCIIVWYRFQ